MIFQKGDICEGCTFDDNNYTSQCRIKNKKKDKDCPCTNCLVKITCINVCIPYTRLVNKINRKE